MQIPDPHRVVAAGRDPYPAAGRNDNLLDLVVMPSKSAYRFSRACIEHAQGKITSQKVSPRCDKSRAVGNRRNAVNANRIARYGAESRASSVVPDAAGTNLARLHH
jgi:hypothetical protein